MTLAACSGELDHNEEIDRAGEHNTTFVVQKVKVNSISEIFSIITGVMYNIYDEDGRRFSINEDMYKKLNAEYNGNIVGHKITVNFSNTKGKHSYSKYIVNYIIIESGKRL